mmetsp:Transcript_25348/g.60592  ORF Transcript_25348/g.60592 Transcript_25348/m.60592 type:complete len:229 (-) Transcript_25348:105-791(-)
MRFPRAQRWIPPMVSISVSDIDSSWSRGTSTYSSEPSSEDRDVTSICSKPVSNLCACWLATAYSRAFFVPGDRGPGVDGGGNSPESSGGGGRRRPVVLVRPVNAPTGVWSARRGGRLSRRMPVSFASASAASGRCASTSLPPDRRDSLPSSSLDRELAPPRVRAPESPDDPEERFSRWAPSFRSEEEGWEGRRAPPWRSSRCPSLDFSLLSADGSRLPASPFFFSLPR